MTAHSRKTAEFEVPSKWREVIIFPPVLPSLDPMTSRNPEMLTEYRQGALRKTLSFWSRKQEKKVEILFWLFIFSFPPPLPLANPAMAVAVAEQQ